jgi:hypothetical protein
MSNFPDEVHNDEKNAQWAYGQMGVMLEVEVSFTSEIYTKK